jgi:hypothetical protein
MIGRRFLSSLSQVLKQGDSGLRQVAFTHLGDSLRALLDKKRQTLSSSCASTQFGGNDVADSTTKIFSIKGLENSIFLRLLPHHTPYLLLLFTDLYSQTILIKSIFMCTFQSSRPVKTLRAANNGGY